MRSAWKMAVLVLLGLGLTGCMWLFPPLQAVLTADDTSGPAPLSVTFSAAGSTGTIVSFTLDFQTDGIVDHTGTNIAVGVSHTYTVPGTYTATLTVQDNRGRTSSATVVITVASAASLLPPVITEFTANTTVDPEVLSFTARAGGPGRTIVSYTLWFGDTTPLLALEGLNVIYPAILTRTIAHDYVQTGSYTAILTVWDDRNITAVQTRSVTVTIP